MADVFTTKHRSVIMSRIKGANTKPEIVVRSLVHSLGYRFRLHNKHLPGKPDLVLPRHKKIILVNGCFWHGHVGCPRSALPSSNVEFWNAKISGNKIRDLSVKRKLKRMGWKVLVIWQCRTRDLEKLRCELQQFLAQRQ
jgi:DNA mismatch endonuclease, patch repair protein